MYLKLGTPGHLISAQFSQSKNVRITFWEKATLLWPRNYPHFRIGPVDFLPSLLGFIS